MNLKIEHLKVFRTVANTGKLADAAVQLGRTPSAVSMMLHQIEDEIGGQLFEGTSKSRLTKLGKFVLTRASRTISEHESAISDIDRFARGEAGIIRVSAVPSVATQLLPHAIAEIRKESDTLKIDIRDADSESVIESVRAGEVDFGIGSGMVSDAEIERQYMFEDPFRLVCPLDHPLYVNKREIELADIDPTEFIANGLCTQINDVEMQRLLQRSSLMLHNTTSLVSFVINRLGVTILPALAIANTNNVRSVPFRDNSLVRRLYILKRFNETLSPASEKLVTILCEKLPEQF